ncbi:hypothetical protein CPB84DRAFT_1959488 [Gymnopilus junonius]|uniref:Uncharacterized protein n=1 Tax=Gymnopilus junonius TaxID=109634 RepID=A0A9P5TQT0_GYMJU|nr:hypothetical protein CPB84DRAFT_1959488 [Gymnopilus junonius]
MVALSDVQVSNARISSALPPGLVAVFVGGTSGIGELTLKKFAKYAVKPRIYFIGRSQDAGDRILSECEVVNPKGEFTFIKADVSLLRVVDNVCRDIKPKEDTINLLFLSAVTTAFGEKTSEDLYFPAVLAYYSRTRFIVNLLPLLRRATSLRRVVTVLAAGREGPINANNFQAAHYYSFAILSARAHIASMITLSLETLAKNSPEVSFIHEFPGFVKTGLGRSASTLTALFGKAIFTIIGPWLFVPNDESGERHLYLATSAKYPSKACTDEDSDLPFADGVSVARGTEGKNGSGVYSVNWDGESSGPQVEEILVKLREDGLVGKLWEHTEYEFERITGAVTM